MASCSPFSLPGFWMISLLARPTSFLCIPPSAPHLHPTSKSNPPCFCPKQEVWETYLSGCEGEGNGGTEGENDPWKVAPPQPADRTAPVQLPLAPNRNQNSQMLYPDMYSHNHKLSSHALFLLSMHLATSLGPTWFHPLEILIDGSELSLTPTSPEQTHHQAPPV